MALVVGVIAGWWYVRNIALYGELTGLLRMVEVAGSRPAGFRVLDLLAEWKGFWYCSGASLAALTCWRLPGSMP